MKNLLVVFFFVNKLFAQSYDIQWQKNIGGSDIDESYSIIQTIDGNFVAIGSTKSNDFDVQNNHGQLDVWIVKLDPNGQIIWKKCFGGGSNVLNFPEGDDEAFSIRETIDGDLIVCGYTASNNFDVFGNNGGTDLWVFKISSVGNLIWQKCLGDFQNERANDLTLTADGGFIVTGFTHEQSLDYWVVKLDSVANIEWQYFFGGSSTDVAESIIQTNDGGYVVAGRHSSVEMGVVGIPGQYVYDSWILKLNSMGILEWSLSIGDYVEDQLFSIIENSQGELVGVGWSNSNILNHHGYNDLWLVKISMSGNLIWQKHLGGTSQDMGYSITASQNGGYLISGCSGSSDGDLTSNNGEYDFWILKVNENGDIQWQKSIGGSKSEISYGVIEANDNSILLTGFSNSDDFDLNQNFGDNDFWVIKLYPNIQNNLIETILPQQKSILLITNLVGQKINQGDKGLKILMFSDGTTEKIYSE